MRYLPLAFMFIVSTAHAQDLVNATAPEPIAALMQDAGLQAQIDKDNSGDPTIISSVSGANFNVLFYGCTAGADCTSLQFYACFKVATPPSLEVINKWNIEIRYGKAYLDAESNPCLEQDVDMTYGIAPDTFKNALQNWAQVLGKYTTTIGYYPG